MSALHFRSMLVRRSTGWSITRSQASMGGCGRASRPRTPRSIETFSTRAPWGKSMPRKKMSLQPLCERSIRTAVRSTRTGKGCSGEARRFSAGRNIQRMVGRMAHAKHPLVAADRADAAADLVGQGLKAQGLVGGGQGAGDGVARPVAFFGRAKFIDRLFETPAQQPGVAFERHQGFGTAGSLAGRW